MGQSRNKLSQLNKPPIKKCKTKENFDSKGNMENKLEFGQILSKYLSFLLEGSS